MKERRRKFRGKKKKGVKGPLILVMRP